MNNKLIILAFASFLSIAGFGQSAGRAFDQEPQVAIYPNPAVETLFIEMKDVPSDAVFELTSMIGTKIKIRPESVGFDKYRINVKELSSGYYFLVIKGRDERFKKAFKFLKN